MSKGTVLVVDDDPAIVTMLRDALENDDYQVLAAVEASALKLARDRHPGVILLDLSMPGMDGMEMSRRLRADPTTRDIPIILMSARHNLWAVSSLASVDSLLPKPFDLDQLYDTVAQLAPDHA